MNKHLKISQFFLNYGKILADFLFTNSKTFQSSSFKYFFIAVEIKYIVFRVFICMCA